MTLQSTAGLHVLQVVLDLGEVGGADDAVGIKALVVSPDHRLAAFLRTARNAAGGFVLSIRDIAAGKRVGEGPEVPASSVAFSHDSQFVVYARPDDAGAPREVFVHEIGNAHSQDVCVHIEDCEGCVVEVAGERRDVAARRRAAPRRGRSEPSYPLRRLQGPCLCDHQQQQPLLERGAPARRGPPRLRPSTGAGPHRGAGVLRAAPPGPPRDPHKRGRRGGLRGDGGRRGTTGAGGMAATGASASGGQRRGHGPYRQLPRAHGAAGRAPGRVP